MEATDIADTILCEIRSGKREQCRARTERLILAVTAAAAKDRALVAAKKAKAQIEELLEEEYSEEFLAKALGYKTGRLQFNFDKITLRNAGRIDALYVRLTTCVRWVR